MQQSVSVVGGRPPENRLHAGIGYVTPDQEHRGEGETIRAARRAGLTRARATRIAYHRTNRTRGPADAD